MKTRKMATSELINHIQTQHTNQNELRKEPLK